MRWRVAGCDQPSDSAAVSHMQQRSGHVTCAAMLLHGDARTSTWLSTAAPHGQARRNGHSKLTRSAGWCSCRSRRTCTAPQPPGCLRPGMSWLMDTTSAKEHQARLTSTPAATATAAATASSSSTSPAAAPETAPTASTPTAPATRPVVASAAAAATSTAAPVMATAAHGEPTPAARHFARSPKRALVPNWRASPDDRTSVRNSRGSSACSTASQTR
jgi:hypothetical protein